jgi:hypothetical protein
MDPSVLFLENPQGPMTYITGMGSWLAYVDHMISGGAGLICFVI